MARLCTFGPGLARTSRFARRGYDWHQHYAQQGNPSPDRETTNRGGILKHNDPLPRTDSSNDEPADSAESASPRPFASKAQHRHGSPGIQRNDEDRYQAKR